MGTFNWLLKVAHSDKERIHTNISRLRTLKADIHDLALMCVSSQSICHLKLEKLIQHPLVKDRSKVHEKLSTALFGENNQKIALDAPMKFREILLDAEVLVNHEIQQESRKLHAIEQRKKTATSSGT